MTPLRRPDWTRAASDDAIAIARQTCRRADLPASVERALGEYEEYVGARAERPILYEALASELAAVVLTATAAAPPCFEWCAPIQRAIDDLRRCRPAERQTYRLALAGKVWRVYREEP